MSPIELGNFGAAESGAIVGHLAWADPEGGRGSGAPSPPPPEKSQKYRVSQQY